VPAASSPSASPPPACSTTAAQSAPDLVAAKRQIVDAFYNAAFDVEDAALRIDREQGWIYMGIDLSPASSPGASIGAAIETISKQALGSSGTMTAVGVITSALKEIGARRTGYSGVMLPSSEDPTLAERWNQGRLSLDQLLSYSAVLRQPASTPFLFPGTQQSKNLPASSATSLRFPSNGTSHSPPAYSLSGRKHAGR